MTLVIITNKKNNTIHTITSGGNLTTRHNALMTISDSIGEKYAKYEISKDGKNFIECDYLDVVKHLINTAKV